MSGQGAKGGWDYTCGFRLSLEDETRLRTAFSKEAKSESAPVKKKVSSITEERPDLPKSSNDSSNSSAAPKSEDRPPLHPAVVSWATIASRRNQGQPNDGDDNSNTQFATLGLWCAYKHGVPCEKSLAMIGQQLSAQPKSWRRRMALPSYRRSVHCINDLRRPDRPRCCKRSQYAQKFRTDDACC